MNNANSKMSVAKFKTSNPNGVLRLEEGNTNDPLDTFLKQSIGRDPLVSLSRASERPVQWIQYLQGFDQPELPGWPLLSPVKVPMQKCDKCSREFFSPINCRRHIRVQHRLRKLDKDTATNRELFGTFWNQLSAEEAKEILSLKGADLEGIDGDIIITNLASMIQKSGLSVLPKTCIRAGSALLDMIQARSSNLLPSAEELFSVLDNASEKTFLCGPAMSMQKYIFDGEAGKIGLETKNVVAFTSFLLEQKLVKAWIADKDAEALRCQQLLMEEEEAAQRKRAEILERKRRKKLRQKAKEQREEQCQNIHEDPDSLTPPPESSGNVIPLDSETPFDAAENRTNSGDHESETDPDLGFGKSSQISSSVEANHARSKSWSWKKKNENNEENGRCNKQEVLIGSISVTVECDSATPQLHDFSGQTDDGDKEHHGTQKKKIHGKSGKFWRPVSRQGTKEPELGPDSEQHIDGQNLPSESSVEESSSSSNADHVRSQSLSLLADARKSAALQFSGHVAEAFLSQRWKEAVTGDHVRLVLFPESEAMEDQVGDRVNSETSTYEAAGNANIRAKPGPGFKKRYVPKIRTGSGT